MDVVWQVQTWSDCTYQFNVADGVVYLPERPNNTLCAVDAADGTLLWRTNITPASTIHFTGPHLAPVCSPENVYCTATEYISGAQYAFILELDRSSGAVKKRIRMDYEYVDWCEGFAYYDDSLIWSDYHGRVLRLDLGSITQTGPGRYEGTPRVIWAVPDGKPMICGSIPVLDGNILYYGFMGDNAYGNHKGYLFAIDLDTDTVLWEKTGIGKTFGWGPCGSRPFYIDGERLYTTQEEHVLYNKWTGDIIWINGTLIAIASSSGIVRRGDHYFITTNATERSPELGDYRKSLYCIDRETGEVVWDYAHTTQLGTTVQYEKGILYIAAPDAFLLFNAATGELLGVDPNAVGDNYQLMTTERVGDLMIVENGGCLYAVRMNWGLDAWGHLVKENP
jgi:outer membrane protein assembly factor BamB